MKKVKVWNEERLEYYKANVGKVKCSHFVEKWGCTFAALKKNVWIWRTQGHEFPHGAKLDIGVVVTRGMKNGTLRDYVKTETGWRVANPKPKKEKVIKPPRVKKEKKPKEPKIRTRIIRPPKGIAKKPVKVFKNRENKEVGGRWVRIDKKTVVYRKTA